MSKPLTAALFSAILFTACATTPKAPCGDTQRVVESVAVLHPECVRLSVHSTPPGGGGKVAIASTSPDKLGKPSDPEDIEAMQSGETIVKEESGAIDFTVPIARRGDSWNAACGVTLTADAGANRDQLRARAQQIARSVEVAMAANQQRMTPR
jgi:hypothetical protein